MRRDWIERDDDFVHRGKLRSDWDEDTTSSSEFVMRGFLKPASSEAELREINTLCKNRVDILSDGKPVSFSLNPNEETALTDGKRVIVGTAVLDTPKSFNEKADIMTGLTTHEMAHILYSKFSDLKKVKDPFHKAILNVIEDERIEHLLTEEFPGYAHNLALTKKYFLEEKYLIDRELRDEKMGLTTYSAEDKAAMELFDLFMRFVRYPKHIDEELMAEYEVEIDDIKAVMTPYPMTPKDALTVSQQVHEIISRGIERKSKEDTSEEGEGEEGEEGEELGSKGKSKRSGKPADGSGTSGSLVEPEDKDEKEAAPSGGEGSEEPELTPEEKIEEAKKRVGEMMKEITSENEDGVAKEVSPKVVTIKFDEEYVYDKEYKANFRIGEANVPRYDKLLSVVSGDARRLANSLFIRVFNEARILRGMRTGSLDESKIIEAAHGVKTVHLTRIPKETKSLNIVILIDESGSMGYQGGDKVDNATSAAILIERAFEVFPVGQLFIYGFTGDNRWPGAPDEDYNQIIRYREPGLKVKKGLGSLRGRSQNRDGHCIRAVARRVRQFTNEPMLFFVISDGQPSSGDYHGYTDTRHAVTEITRQRFFPIQIGIGKDLSPEEQARMFDEFIHYNTSKQMVEDLRKLIIRKAHKIFGL